MKKELTLLMLIPAFSMVFASIPVASASSGHWVEIAVYCYSPYGAPATYSSLRYAGGYVEVTCPSGSGHNADSTYAWVTRPTSYFAETKVGATFDYPGHISWLAYYAPVQNTPYSGRTAGLGCGEWNAQAGPYGPSGPYGSWFIGTDIYECGP